MSCVDSLYAYQVSFGLASGQVLCRIQGTLLPSSVNPRYRIRGITCNVRSILISGNHFDLKKGFCILSVKIPRKQNLTTELGDQRGGVNVEMAMGTQNRVPNGFCPIRRRVWNYISTRGYINGQHHVPIG
jgi:hypothetical protein